MESGHPRPILARCRTETFTYRAHVEPKPLSAHVRRGLNGTLVRRHHLHTCTRHTHTQTHTFKHRTTPQTQHSLTHTQHSQQRQQQQQHSLARSVFITIITRHTTANGMPQADCRMCPTTTTATTTKTSTTTTVMVTHMICVSRATHSYHTHTHKTALPNQKPHGIAATTLEVEPRARLLRRQMHVIVGG